ncbi:MAG: PAS domain S-box protein, partial [Chloroflexi bacterium]|nr:PAS domain S-box protein [Chloroflexota bacterium]
VSYLADVAWEITRRKRAEEALKESEAKYSAVVERANDGLAIVHKERIVFVNKALSEITGYSVSELEGKVLLQVMTPESAEYALGIYQRRMSGKPVPSMYQVTALRKDGTTRSVEISAGTIPYRGDLASIAVIRDITERKRAEEALAESEQAFRNLAEHSPSMIFINVRGKVLYANERSAEAMGYTREEYYSPDFDFLTLMDPGSLETVRRNLARHRSGEDVPPYEYTLRTKDGKRIDAIISTKLIQHRGESAILGIVTDITDLKRAQKTIEESERKLSTLMSNLPGIAYRRANNRNWTMHFLSEGCRDLTGYAPEDLLHDRRLAFNDLINPEHRGMVWTETQAALSRREHFSFEYAITTAGGVEKWVWEKGCGIFSPDGRAEILEGFISDVTERKRAEEKLRQSEERNEALLAAVPDIIMEVDTAKVYTWANEAGLEFFGHDVIGKEASFYFEGEQETYGIVQPLFEGAENVIYVESWQRRKDGEKRLLAWWCRVLKDSSGNVTGALSTARDITERKRAEEALRQREYQIRTLFENASDAILYLDESGRVIECNQRIKDIFGYEPEEAIGKSFAEFPFVEPDMMSQILTEFDRMLESGESRLLEFESKRQDGQTLFVEASTRMMDPNTGIRGTLTIIRDITERRKAEAALKESETKYRQLFESISDVVYSVDTEFRILSVSPSVREILGYAPEEIIGKRFTDTNLLTGEDLKLAAEDTLRVLAGEEVIRTYKFIAKDGSIRIGEAKGTPLIREGQTIGTIAVARDITERKRAEEREKEAEKLREIDRMRTDLLANVSHELRTPLTTIKGYATMLTEYPDKLKSEEKTRYLEAIERSSDRLNELIDSLLDMSRIDAGMLRIDRRPSEILPILQQAAAEAQVRSPTHVIVTNVPSQLPMARFDPRRIRQVMDNIIDNAIKYSPKGTTIRVEATRSESNLQVSVSDQGVGIPAAELERVFDRMYRVKRDATARVAGVGLGLSICRGVVDAHGGKIWMESVEGQGSTCFFTLPLDTEEDGHDKQA